MPPNLFPNIIIDNLHAKLNSMIVQKIFFFANICLIFTFLYVKILIEINFSGGTKNGASKKT